MTKSEIRLFLREPFSIVFVLVFPLMMMMLLAAVFGDDQEEAQAIENGMLVWRGVVPSDYYSAASIAAIIAALGLMTLPINLAGYREQGILKRMRASSASAWMIFSSQLTVALLAFVAGSVIMGFVAWLAYDAMLPQQPLGVVVAILCGTLSFGAIGLLLSTLMGSSRAAQGIGLLLFFGMWLISGSAPPRAVLPSGLRDFSDLLPLTHLVLAIQDPWFGYGWSWTSLGVLAGFAVATAVPALWFFRWD